MSVRRLCTSCAALLAGLLLHAQQIYVPPVPQAPELRQRDSLTLVFIGDVMMHSKQLHYDSSTFLEGLEELLGGADFAIANAEFTLAGEPYSGYPAFSAPDSYAVSLRDDAGIDVFLTANNHILDKGAKGMARTLAVYDSLGVRHCGSGVGEEDFESRNPLYLFARGIKIALVNFSYGTNLGSPRSPSSKVAVMRKDELTRQFSKAVEEGADFIIALPHWGTEYSLLHDGSQEEWAHWLVENGADAVIGTHPHVIQDSCSIDGVPVFYSLGNSVSNMSAENTRLGMALELRVVKNHADGSIESVECRPHFTWCTLPGTLTPSYKTIIIKEWATRRGEWLTPYDFDNMMKTLERVCTTTGLVCPL